MVDLQTKLYIPLSLLELLLLPLLVMTLILLFIILILPVMLPVILFVLLLPLFPVNQCIPRVVFPFRLCCKPGFLRLKFHSFNGDAFMVKD